MLKSCDDGPRRDSRDAVTCSTSSRSISPRVELHDLKALYALCEDSPFCSRSFLLTLFITKMGFFKKFFSLGKKKGKKSKHDLQSRPYESQATLQLPKNEGDSEVAESRLLRSSSAHFRVMAERDFRELPPLRM